MAKAKKTMELVINARADHNGILWFILREAGSLDGSGWGGAIAMYMERSQHLKVRTDCNNLFVGIDVAGMEEPLTFIVREISRFFTGHPHMARFSRATHDRVNAGVAALPEEVSPVLYFWVREDYQHGASTDGT